MIEPTKIVETLVVDRDLVLQFFGLFSRFEYSLKRSGFLKTGSKAEPNWDKYANSIQGRFGQLQDAEFQKAVAFLLKEPPKTQVVSGNNLGWSNTLRGPGEHQERYVLRLVSTVRNNLFHGGKYPHPFGPMGDVARNRDLLEGGIIVLRQCLELSDDVRTTFEQTA